MTSFCTSELTTVEITFFTQPQATHKQHHHIMSMLPIELIRDIVSYKDDLDAYETWHKRMHMVEDTLHTARVVARTYIRRWGEEQFDLHTTVFLILCTRTLRWYMRRVWCNNEQSLNVRWVLWVLRAWWRRWRRFWGWRGILIPTRMQSNNVFSVRRVLRRCCVTTNGAHRGMGEMLSWGRAVMWRRSRWPLMARTVVQRERPLSRYTLSHEYDVIPLMPTRRE